MSGDVQFIELPLDISALGLIRAYEIHVPNERGSLVKVNVLHNLVRKSYEVEFTEEILLLAPQGVTAVVQLVMLELQARHSDYENK